MADRPRVGVLALARSTFDVDFAEEMSQAAFAVLSDLGGEVIGEQRLLFDAESTEAATDALAATSLDLLVVMQVTFTDASMMQVIGERIAAPVVLWGFPEPRLGGRLRLNSFCGINLAAYTLRRLGRGYRYLFADPRRPETRRRLLEQFEAENLPTADHEVPDPSGLEEEAVRRAERVRERLAAGRVGVIGEAPLGFYPCRYDPGNLEGITGVVVEEIDLQRLFSAARTAEPAAVAAARERAAEALAGIDDVDQSELDNSLRLFPTLHDMAAEAGLDAMAVRCWPEAFTEYGGAVCAPAGMLNEAMLPTACEADAYGSVTALMLQWLSGEPALVADLIDVDTESDTGVLWHCGKGPLSMADPGFAARATVHSNRRKPLLHEFPFKPGRITIARLSQSRGTHSLVVGGGEMMEAPLPFSGTAGVVRFDRSVADVTHTVMAEGLEHHYGFTYGDVRAELHALAGAWGIPVVEL